MKDEELQKPMTVKLNVKPYYRKVNETWIIQQTQPSYHYMLKGSIGLANKPEKPKGKVRPNEKGGGVSIDYWNNLLRLSNEYGNSYRHPRTYEYFPMVSESRRSKESLRLRLKDNVHYNGLPRTPYKRSERVTAVKLKVKDGKKEFVPDSLFIGKKNKRWSSIWVMSKRKAPRKYNVWGNTRYNWGDSGIVKLQRITERCEWLAKKIRG